MFCKECGEKIGGDVKFCSNCGTVVGAYVKNTKLSKSLNLTQSQNMKNKGTRASSSFSEACLERDVSGYYSGTVCNKTLNIQSPINLNLKQNGDKLSGDLEITSPKLGGGGAIEGYIKGTEIVFFTSFLFVVKIEWSGNITARGIIGTYFAKTPFLGREDGTWEVTLNNSVKFKSNK